MLGKIFGRFGNIIANGKLSQYIDRFYLLSITIINILSLDDHLQDYSCELEKIAQQEANKACQEGKFKNNPDTNTFEEVSTGMLLSSCYTIPRMTYTGRISFY